jgi:hypothetical protein
LGRYAAPSIRSRIHHFVSYLDVGASPGNGEDESFVAEDLDRSQDRVTAHVVLLLDLLHGRQRAVAPFAFGDPCPEDGG